MAIQILINPEPTKYARLFKEAGATVGIDYEIEPDFDEYKNLIANDQYLFIGAENAGRPIGYVGVFLSQSIFNRAVSLAVVDSFFVLPGFRKSTVAGRLIAAMEKHIKADRLFFQCERGNPLAAMLIRRGFREVDCTYEKVRK